MNKASFIYLFIYLSTDFQALLEPELKGKISNCPNYTILGQPPK